MDKDSKPNDFGGIPTGVFNKILAFFTAPLAAGVTDAMASAVLFEMVRERHAALIPGPGRTGFMDAYKAFEELDAAIAEFQAAAGAKIAPAVTRLGAAIAALAQLWANGPVADEFFSE
jgi:hypothetical protein